MPLYIAFGALLILGSALTAAPVPKELKARRDSERIQGLWHEEATRSHWLFQGEMVFAGGTPAPDGTGYGYAFSIKPEASPPEFELVGGVNFAGIYKFVGEDLHLAYSGGPRPTDFTPGPNKHIHIFKRVPEAKK